MGRPEISVEAARDKLLRRVDWRFLLPNPSPVRTYCTVRGDLERAVSMISGSVVTPPFSPRQDCDLAVAVDPTPADLHAAWNAVCPGGSCYAEWRMPFVGGVKGVRRRLERAGFTNVRLYGCWPPVELARARFWLPLDAPGTIDSFWRKESAARRAKTLRFQIFWRLLHLLVFRLGWTGPVRATCQKPSSNDSEPARPALDLMASIDAEWDWWNLGAKPASLSMALLTSGHRSISKVVALVAGEPDGATRLVVKMPRVPEAEAGLMHEANVLRALARDGVLGIPRVLFTKKFDRISAVGLTVVTGPPIARVLSWGDYYRTAIGATDWIAALATNREPAFRNDWRELLVLPLVREFQATFGEVIDPELLRDMEQALAKLGPLPFVWEHRDFSPWNIHAAQNGSLCVLDWESAVFDGLPALDLVYFLTYLQFVEEGAMESGRLVEAYQRGLDTGTLPGRIRAECLERYGAKLGLNLDVLSPLLPLTWIVHARSEHQRLLADIGPRLDREALAGSLFVQFWREEALRLRRQGHERTMT